MAARWFFYSLSLLLIIYSAFGTHYNSVVLIISAPPDVVVCFLLGNEEGGNWNPCDSDLNTEGIHQFLAVQSHLRLHGNALLVPATR